uniref:Thymus, brain and testes associated n=1 Tax=Myripristis murdjan TaxID=586833 RepID=A0A667XL35_9TELE
MYWKRSSSHVSQVPFTSELTKMVTKSSPRFGTLSHHSFFSRHNPHPHRVTHIQGLNGRPVCMVRDDWSVTTSLFPHPLIKSQSFRTAMGTLLSLSKNALNTIAAFIQTNFSFSFCFYLAALLSDAWREELKDFALNGMFLCMLHVQDPPEEGFGRRKTQYSAQTGRIIPPSSKAYQRRSYSQRLAYPQPFHDQELMVLELLCQILQTDSLSLVQQWLLLAGQRGKRLCGSQNVYGDFVQ